MRKPQNRYVIGHGSFKRRALTDEQLQEAMRLREEGTSLATLAERFGTTPATIANRVDHGGYVPPEKHQHRVITKEDVELNKALRALRQATRSVLDCVKLIRWKKKTRQPGRQGSL